MKYFLCYGKLYRTTEFQYRVLLERVRDNIPFDLSDFPFIEEVGVLGLDIGVITREQATKELKRNLIKEPE